MNYNHLSDSEFLDKITIEGNNDPVVLRLIKIISNSVAEEAISELVRMGMDKDTWEMNYEGLLVSPAEYIRKLESDLEWRNEEYGDLEFKLDQSNKELEQMKTRSVSDLIAELRQELRTADYNVAQANERTVRAKNSEKVAKEKLDMWAIMNR